METRNGKFREMIYINEKAIKSPFFKRKTDAKDWLRNQVSRRDKMIASGETLTNTSITFIDHAEYWLKYSIKNSKSKSTYASYERAVRVHLEPLLKETKLAEIRITHAEALLDKLKSENKKPKGINDILTIFKAIIKDAEKREMISKNPLRFFSQVKVPQQDFRYWSEHDINKFLIATKDLQEFPFYVTAIYTGMRRGEIAGLCWDCINFQKKLITIKRTKGRFGLSEKTKTGNVRHIPMNDFLYRILLNQFDKRKNNSNFVFTDKNGEPISPNHLYRSFGQLQRKIGIENVITVHDLRHTFASQLMMKGANIYDLSKLLGHSEVKMTQRYAHLSPDHLANATQRLSFEHESEIFFEVNPMLTPINLDNKTEENVLVLKAVTI